MLDPKRNIRIRSWELAGRCQEHKASDGVKTTIIILIEEPNGDTEAIAYVDGVEQESSMEVAIAAMNANQKALNLLSLAT